MAEQIQWNIPSYVASYLGSLTAGPRNDLSWFTPPGMSAFIGQQNQESSSSHLNNSDILRDAGILDVQRNVSPAFMHALQVLANPGARFLIKQELSPTADSLVFYLNSSLADPVSVIQSGDRLSIIDSAQPSLLQDFTSERTGNSRIQAIRFDASLTTIEAFAAAASFDCIRRNSGLALLTGEPCPSIPLRLDEILSGIEPPSANAQWLVFYLQRLCPTSLSVGDLINVLNSLQQKGLCTLLPEGVQWSPTVEALAKTMILMDQVFDLEISRLHRNGQVTSIRQFCYQSGVHNLLRFDLEADGVNLCTTTAQLFVDHVVKLLTEGIHKIPEPVALTGDATRQIATQAPSWELRPVGQGDRISIITPVRIGRSPENQVVLSETSVSRTHCLIEIIDGACWITDLHSSNGTLVNGKRISMPARLQAKDLVQLGILKYEVFYIRPDLSESDTTIRPGD